MDQDQAYKKHLFICTNQKPQGKACCANTGGLVFFDYLKTRLKTQGLHGPGKIRVSQSGCLGRCSLGPCIVIYPEAIWYTYKTVADIDEIISTHLICGQIVRHLQI